MRNRSHPQTPAWRSAAGRFFYSWPGVFDPVPDGLLVPLTSATGWFLPTPTKAMQQAADVIAVIANAEVSPNQVGYPLRGPHAGGKPVGFGAPHQQTRKLGQLCASQFGRATRARNAAQPRRSSPAGPTRPLMHGLSAHAQLTGNSGQRFAPLDAGQGGQAARLQHSSVSSHNCKIPWPIEMSSYLCRGL